MSNTVNVTNQNFQQEVLNSNIPVLVDFWAPWCQPCLMMSPVLEDLATDMVGKIKIAKLNTEVPENQQLAIKYQIQSIPNMKLFKNGEVVKEFIGLRPKELLQQELETEL
ncbi:thioredoxin [Candidatus Shapirobacteria bacterium]|nr:MAG: thioredoxin [Candidatus Shapirobacteria bacterium]